MIKFLISRIKRRSLERQRAICREAYDEAVSRRDTRRQHEAAEALKRATTAVLRAEVAR